MRYPQLTVLFIMLALMLRNQCAAQHSSNAEIILDAESDHSISELLYRQDSLFRVAQKMPKYIYLTYEVNKVPTTYTGQVMLSIDTQQVILRTDSANRYPLNYAINARSLLSIRMIQGADTFYKKISNPMVLSTDANITYGLITDMTCIDCNYSMDVPIDTSRLSKGEKLLNDYFHNKLALMASRMNMARELEYMIIEPHAYALNSSIVYFRYLR